jgi:aminoglycoside 6'-N-acetyltransferase
MSEVLTAPVVRLRPATLTDLDRLERWDEEPHVVAADPNDDWGWTKELGLSPDWREQLIAEVDGRPVGFIQIIDPALEDSHYWGDCGPNLRAIDIWIGDAGDLGKGYGSAMMRQAIDRCFASATVTEILIDPLESNTDAHRFYQRFGFTPVGVRTLGEHHDICLVHRLTRAAWQARPTR